MSIIDRFIERYEREMDFYEKAARLVSDTCEEWLKENGIRAIVSYRAKSLNSLRAKVEYRNKSKKYRRVEDVYLDIFDLSGVRVALYFPQDVERGQKDNGRYFECSEIKSFPLEINNSNLETKPKGKIGKSSPEKIIESNEKSSKKFSGYHARHFRVRLINDDPRIGRYAKAQVEIQVASVLMHAWSEVEHDLMYKPLSGEPSGDEKAILDQINGLVISGEIALNLLQKAFVSRIEQSGRKFENQYELAAFLSGIMKEGNSKNSEMQLSRTDALLLLIQALKIDTPELLNDFVKKAIEKRSNESIVDSIVEEIVSLSDENAKAYADVFDTLNKSNELYQIGIDPIYELGRFIKSWSILSDLMRKIYEMRNDIMDNRISMQNGVSFVARKLKLSENDTERLRLINEIRNRILHNPLGKFAKSAEEYKRYVKVLYNILEKIETVSNEEEELKQKTLDVMRELVG